MDDPAWWWVKASNLGGLGGPVVRFNLSHVIHKHTYREEEESPGVVGGAIVDVQRHG